tara:strand:+ start:641 stop:892 length:252 start_codon:yes stop_codon:yes gene_type:complete
MDELSKLRNAKRPALQILNEIVGVMHCRKCLKEFDDQGMALLISPADYAALDVGWTPTGIQVWCRRHNYNVLSLTLEGDNKVL